MAPARQFVLTTVAMKDWDEGESMPGYETWVPTDIMLNKDEWDKLCAAHRAFNDHVQAATTNRIPPYRVGEKLFTKTNMFVMERDVGLAKVSMFKIKCLWLRVLEVHWTPEKLPEGGRDAASENNPEDAGQLNQNGVEQIAEMPAPKSMDQLVANILAPQPMEQQIGEQPAPKSAEQQGAERLAPQPMKKQVIKRPVPKAVEHHVAKTPAPKKTKKD